MHLSGVNRPWQSEMIIPENPREELRDDDEKIYCHSNSYYPDDVRMCRREEDRPGAGQG